MKMEHIREHLWELAALLDDPDQPLTTRDRHELALRICRLAEATRRRKGVRRTPVKSKRITLALAQSIRTEKWLNPDASHQEIADKYGVNSARISEVLIGKKD